MLSERAFVRIRDPIHGSIPLSREELPLVDSPAFQRLRMIKQLGLADLAFPGATHTRYAHGLGAMHVATRMFTQIARVLDLPKPEAERFGETVRLAALFHDLGHAPLSHTTEAFMPKVRALELGPWQEGGADRRANHEDYTLKILVDSDLRRRIETHVTPGFGVTPEDIATLVAGWAPDEAQKERFRLEGVDHLPLLRMCVSSELDADRMDYLLRDSYFAGVPYGRYDLEWIVDNLSPAEIDGALYLGLDARASFGFEDFLLSRYHMFASIYFHQIPIGYEVMLRRFHADCPNELVVPADVDGYLACDDVYLWSALRKSTNEWARRVVERRAYRMVFESKGFDDAEAEKREQARFEQMLAALEAARAPALPHNVRGELSKYFRFAEPSSKRSNLYIVDGGRNVPVEEYTPLYRRYAGGVNLHRIYVEPGSVEAAKAALARFES